jgi:superfamily II DNA/RNA helicase
MRANRSAGTGKTLAFVLPLVQRTWNVEKIPKRK